MRLRSSEWLLVAYFAYVAALSLFFPGRPYLGYKPFYALALAVLLIAALAFAGRRYPIFNMIRDWTPLAFTLGAFREMDWFTPARYTLEWERVWLQQDRLLLTRLGLARALEALGPVVPGYLELCYLLVYATGAFCVLTLWLTHRRAAVGPLDGRLPHRDAAGLCAVSILPFAAAPEAAAPDAGRSGGRRHVVPALELVAARCGDDSQRRVSKRARVLGLLGGLGTVRRPPKAAWVCVGDAVLCMQRFRRDDLWTLPLRGGRGSGIRPHPRGRGGGLRAAGSRRLQPPIAAGVPRQRLKEITRSVCNRWAQPFQWTLGAQGLTSVSESLSPFALTGFCPAERPKPLTIVANALIKRTTSVSKAK
jgi:hypothetical protein